MINSIKKKSVPLLITLLTLTTTSSASTLGGIKQDSIVSITQKELKETDLIFAEHKKLLTENKLLKEQIQNYKSSNQVTSRIDSLKSLQLLEYDRLYKESIEKEKKLSSQITRKNRALLVWRIGGISVSAGFLLFLFLK